MTKITSNSLGDSCTFDDVLLVPAYSEVLPKQADTTTVFTRSIRLNIPLVSSAMDTVTESGMAIRMAQLGGIGVIHRSLSPGRQASEVRRVKRFESGMVEDPITIHADKTLGEALKLMKENNISGIPVVAKKTRRLVGILTNRDVRFADDMTTPVVELMTKRLVTVDEGTDKGRAKHLLHKHRIEKLLVVNKSKHCVGLITVKDINKAEKFPNAAKDSQGSLLVAAAVGVGKDEILRASMLVDAGVDAIVIDTAHGHTVGVINQVVALKKMYPRAQVVAGNVATKDAVKDLVDVGVDAIKVGIGPGSICTTRVITGVGVAQLSAILDTCAEADKTGTPIIADGGIKFSGDFAKAIAAGASSVMVGSILAGTDEAPGAVFFYQGRAYKGYHGMGSEKAMQKGSHDRYFQDVAENGKYVPEGVEGRVAYRGSADGVIYQLVGGLRSSMGYTGNATIASMRSKCKFCRITNASLKESHVHGVIVTREAPNYHQDTKDEIF